MKQQLLFSCFFCISIKIFNVFAFLRFFFWTPSNVLSCSSLEIIIFCLEQERSFSKDDYKLRSELIALKLDKERLEQEKEEGLGRESHLNERVLMLEEMLAVKDEIVVQLSNKVGGFDKLLLQIFFI